MELERSPPAALSVSPWQHVPRRTSRSAAAPGPVVAASKASTSSLFSSAVREMLLVQNSKAMIKKPRSTLLRLPPSGDNDERRKPTAAFAEPAESAARSEKAARSAERMRQALAKRVAKRMLKRGASPEEKVLTCCCQRLPPGLRCALHQGAPGRSWMRGQRSGGGGGGSRVGEAVAPKACGRGGWVFSEYARWRRNVWMPSRFYLEHVEGGPDQSPSSSTAGSE